MKLPRGAVVGCPLAGGPSPPAVNLLGVTRTPRSPFMFTATSMLL